MAAKVSRLNEGTNFAQNQPTKIGLEEIEKL